MVAMSLHARELIELDVELEGRRITIAIKYNNAFPSIWFRYVDDDLFTLFDSKNTATQFLHYLNNYHANIKSPLHLKITVPSLSWTFSTNATVILSQRLFTERRRLLDCTQNGIPSHLGNTK